MAVAELAAVDGTREDGTVEVVYAVPDAQTIVYVPFVPGLTAGEAVQRSGLVMRFPKIGHGPLVLGRHGTVIAAATPLKPGDRVEICRPLVADPRQMRAEVAARGEVMGRRCRGD